MLYLQQLWLLSFIFLILSSSDMPRDTRYTNNEPEGTYFQELVVFPTLAPQLAHPQNVVDGVPRAIPAAAVENGGKFPLLSIMLKLILCIRKSA